MPTKKSAKKKAAPIFQWTFKGTDVAGTTPIYTVQLKSDGTTSCNCPGWVFHRKKDQPRICKHTRSVQKDSEDMYKKWKRGEPLPKIMVDPLASVVFSGGGNINQKHSEYGRIIELD